MYCSYGVGFGAANFKDFCCRPCSSVACESATEDKVEVDYDAVDGMSTARDSDNVCVSAAMTLLAIDSGCGLARKQRHCECGCASYSAARRSRASLQELHLRPCECPV